MTSKRSEHTTPLTQSLPPDSLLRFSWIIDARLAVGPAPRSYDALADRDFTAAVNLQEESEPGPARQPTPPGFRVIQIPMRDGIVGGVPTVDQVARAVEAIRELVEEGRKTYVHCYAGVGRSPLCCIAYLARHHDLDLREATARVVERHPMAAPNARQMGAVDRYLRGE